MKSTGFKDKIQDSKKRALLIGKGTCDHRLKVILFKDDIDTKGKQGYYEAALFQHQFVRKR
jgi:hypothetical protein